MKKALTILFFSLAYLSGNEQFILAQPLGSRTELFNIENGLSQTGINHILYDSRGYLWLATQDGLDRYDGNNFFTFKHHPSDSNSLCDNYVRHICEDHEGNIWIATINGLSKYNLKNGTFTNFFNDPNDANSISDNSIYYIYQDREKVLWIKTLESLEKFDVKKNRFIHYYHYNNVFNYISGNFKFSILEDKDGKLWIGSKDGLNCFDRNLELFERFANDPLNQYSISNNHIKTICEDAQGKLWIGTEKGLNCYDKQTKKFKRFYNVIGNNKSITDNSVNTISLDKNNNLWIGTENGFCNYDYRTATFKQYHYIYINYAKLFLTGIKSIVKDNANILWIGSNQGLIKIDMKPFKFKVYRHYEENTNEQTGIVISSLCMDNHDNIWIGTRGNGLTIYNRGKIFKETFSSLTHPQILKDDNIFVIYPDKNNYLWIGTKNGIVLYNKKTEQFNKLCNLNHDCSFLDNNQVYTILQDRRGLIWIGTEHGLHTYNSANKQFENYIQIPDSNGIRVNSVYCMTEDSSGYLWFGLNNGLIKFNPETKQYKKYESNRKINIKSLSSNSIYSLLYSSNNILWVGTTSGLCRYNQKTDDFTIFTEDDGLPNNLIYAMLEDNSGNIWFSTNRGLAQLNKNLETFINFDLADGLQSYEFNKGAAFKSNKGELFFGGIEGYNSFFPDSIHFDDVKPNVEITSIEITGSSFKKKISVWPDQIVHIPSGTNMFTIFFAVLDFTFPHNNQYMYMLSSKAKDGLWINNGNRNYISFSNLPAGTYYFSVRGANSDMVWGDKEYGIEIIVESPIWSTNSAIIFYIVIFVLTGFIAFQLRTRKLRQSNKILKEKELAAHEISRQKEELSIKNKNITDSINYAKRIQIAMMPSERTFKKLLSESFIYHKPRDIVSGDFYWIYERNGKVFVAAVDCTGHGVPGAFMSILGVELFRKITLDQIEDPGLILKRINEDFSTIFHDIEDISLKDGMDISFCAINKEKYIMHFAGAFNPLYIVRDNKIIEIKGNRFSVSMEKKQEAPEFTTHEVPLQKEDMIYIFSDGYADQFGGYEGKKFKYRRFRHMLLNIHKLPLESQKAYLEESMNVWKGNFDQVDDILVIGIKANFN